MRASYVFSVKPALGIGVRPDGFELTGSKDNVGLGEHTESSNNHHEEGVHCLMIGTDGLPNGN